MDAGRLIHNITIEAPSRTRNQFGENIPIWSTFATTRAEIKTLTGKPLELAQASTITSTATHAIAIRWRAGLLTTHRIKYVGDGRTRYFTLNSISDPDQTRVELRIIATEVVG